jgi:hypothetical protein
VNLFDIANIVKRIGVENQQVGHFAFWRARKVNSQSARLGLTARVIAVSVRFFNSFLPL